MRIMETSGTANGRDHQENGDAGRTHDEHQYLELISRIIAKGEKFRSLFLAKRRRSYKKVVPEFAGISRNSSII